MKLRRTNIRIGICLIAAAFSIPGSINATPGSVDLAFNPQLSLNGGAPIVYAVKLQPDGKILVGGEFTTYNGVGRKLIARSNPDGSLDTSLTSPLDFTPQQVGFVNHIAIQSDGKILVSGFFNVNGQIKIVARLNADGSLDNSFNPNIVGNEISEIVVQPDGKIIIAGRLLQSVDGVAVNNLARLNPNGSLDTALGITGNLLQGTSSIALQPDGKIVVGGANFVARLDAAGTSDPGFTRRVGAFIVYAIDIQADGKIVIGGYNEASDSGTIFRLNGPGTPDATFIESAVSHAVYSVVIQPDGKILVGGAFTQIGNTARGRIARLNPDGALDSFHPNPNGANRRVYGLAAQTDGKVLIAGDFDWLGDINNVSRTGFARLFGEVQPLVGRIVYNSRPNSVSLDVISMNADGSNQTVLTTIDDASDYDPSLSSDGTKIAFVSNRDGDEDIYVMNADGSGQTALTINDAIEITPAFSPDGTKITFATQRDGNYEIYTMDANGANQTRITNNSTRDDEPSYSPDGSKIVFRSFRDGGNPEIYVMDANGANQIRLTTNTVNDSQPTFSPDGTKIAFSSFLTGNAEIYVMNADGSAPVNLTNNPATDIQPSFSPDGSKIAFATNRDGAGAPGLEIYVMDAGGSNPVRYTNNTVEDSNPWWSGAQAPPPVTPIKLKLDGGNLLVGSPGEGLILRSPNGVTCIKLAIDNAGAMTATSVTCP